MNITDPITIALTKGRILKETLPLLAKVGIEPSEDLDGVNIVLSENFKVCCWLRMTYFQ